MIMSGWLGALFGAPTVESLFVAVGVVMGHDSSTAPFFLICASFVVALLFAGGLTF